MWGAGASDSGCQPAAEPCTITTLTAVGRLEGDSVRKAARDPAWWVLVIATAAAFVLRYWFISTAWIEHPVRGDALDYVSYAANLIQHHVFSVASGGAPVVPDSYRDPGYPTFLAPFLALIQNAGLRYRTLQTTQALLGALTVTAYLCLARRWLSLPWLIVTAVLLAIWPHSITAPAYLLSETLLGFLISVALATVAKGLAEDRAGRLTAGGLLFGCAALTNAVMAPFLPVVAAAGYLAQPARRRRWVILLVASLALPGLWAIRNAAFAEGPAASQRAVTNLVQGSWPEYHSAWLDSLSGDPAGVAMTRRIDQEVSLAVHDRRAGMTSLVNRLGAEPERYAAWYASKPALLWSWSMRIASGHIYVFPTVDSPLESNDIAWYTMQALVTANPIVAILALLGCVVVIIGRADRQAGMTAVLLLYVTAVYSVLQSEPRYAVPFRGAEIVMAALGAAWLSAGFLTLWRRRLGHLATSGTSSAGAAPRRSA